MKLKEKLKKAFTEDKRTKEDYKKAHRMYMILSIFLLSFACISILFDSLLFVAVFVALGSLIFSCSTYDYIEFRLYDLLEKEREKQ